jgi:pyruvate/2-oxoglutarate dehydrogenase complex dihydrolipoamide dehydrogenase (E3) component
MSLFRGTISDAQRHALKRVAGARIINIGPGFISAEFASAAALHGMGVAMIKTNAVPFTNGARTWA